jgi:hypothetical protein
MRSERKIYYKLLSFVYLLVLVQLYKVIAPSFDLPLVLAETWFELSNWILLSAGGIMLLGNTFLMDFRYGSGPDRAPHKPDRIQLFHEFDSKSVSNLFIYPLLLAAGCFVQFGDIWMGCAVLSLFYSWYLFNGTVNKGEIEMLTDEAKKGVQIEDTPPVHEPPAKRSNFNLSNDDY